MRTAEYKQFWNNAFYLGIAAGAGAGAAFLLSAFALVFGRKGLLSGASLCLYVSTIVFSVIAFGASLGTVLYFATCHGRSMWICRTAPAKKFFPFCSSFWGYDDLGNEGHPEAGWYLAAVSSFVLLVALCLSVVAKPRPSFGRYYRISG